MKITPIALHDATVDLESPLMSSMTPCGFPSPAENFAERALDLNGLLIKHPSATFYAIVSGDSMTGVGIFDRDILVVDRAVTAVQGNVVLAAIDGELCCKIFDERNRQLLSSNSEYAPIPIGEDVELLIEGVVTCSLRLHVPISMG